MIRIVASTRGIPGFSIGLVVNERIASIWSVTSVLPSPAESPDPTRPATSSAVSTGSISRNNTIFLNPNHQFDSTQDKA